MILKIYDLREPVSPVMSFNGVLSFKVTEHQNAPQVRTLEVKFDDREEIVKMGLGLSHAVYSKREKYEVTTEVQDNKDRG